MLDEYKLNSKPAPLSFCIYNKHFPFRKEINLAACVCFSLQTESQTTEGQCRIKVFK